MHRIVKGLICLGITVIIWVGSAELIQWIFQGKDTNFNKPYFLTYLSESLYSLYLFALIPYYRYKVTITIERQEKRDKRQASFALPSLNSENQTTLRTKNPKKA